MSRKFLFTVLAVLGAAGAVISQEFGLTVKIGAVVAGLVAVAVYVFNEAKADLKALSVQKAKWSDPKFIITLISAIVAALAQQVQLPVSPEIIITVLTVIVGLLFKTKPSVRLG